MLDVALATCVELPEPDHDLAPLVEALRSRGLRCEPLGWDDPEADFGSARMTVLRSTWNYPHRPDEFLAWVADVSRHSALHNPVEVVRWNLHKKYLKELERSGLPTTPTELVASGSCVTLGEIVDRRGWRELVVKPAVSASSYGTLRAQADQLVAAEEHLNDLRISGDAMVQEFLPSVESYGERALMWIDGELTHAVRKSPRFSGDSEAVSTAAVEIDADEAALAERTVRWAEERFGVELLYARIDMAPGADGAPALMELELIEPSLYFGQSGDALDRLAEAIGRRLPPS